MNTIQHKQFKVLGMNCPSCASLIQMELEDGGIENSCSYASQTLTIKNSGKTKKAIGIVQKLGYTLKQVVL